MGRVAPVANVEVPPRRVLRYKWDVLGCNVFSITGLLSLKSSAFEFCFVLECSLLCT